MQLRTYILISFLLFLVAGCASYTKTIQDVPTYLCDKLENSRQQHLSNSLSPNTLVSGSVYICPFEGENLYLYVNRWSESGTSEFYDSRDIKIGAYSGDIIDEKRWATKCSYKGTPCFKIQTCQQKPALCEYTLSGDPTSTYNRSYKDIVIFS